MKRYCLVTFGLSTIVAFILVYLGVPMPTGYSETYCGRHHTFCPYVSPYTFLAKGIIDFALVFVIVFLVSKFVLVPILKRSDKSRVVEHSKRIGKITQWLKEERSFTFISECV